MSNGQEATRSLYFRVTTFPGPINWYSAANQKFNIVFGINGVVRPSETDRLIQCKDVTQVGGNNFTHDLKCTLPAFFGSNYRLRAIDTQGGFFFANSTALVRLSVQRRLILCPVLIMSDACVS